MSCHSVQVPDVDDHRPPARQNELESMFEALLTSGLASVADLESLGFVLEPTRAVHHNDDEEQHVADVARKQFTRRKGEQSLLMTDAVASTDSRTTRFPCASRAANVASHAKEVPYKRRIGEDRPGIHARQTTGHSSSPTNECVMTPCFPTDDMPRTPPNAIRGASVGTEEPMTIGKNVWYECDAIPSTDGLAVSESTVVVSNSDTEDEDIDTLSFPSRRPHRFQSERAREAHLSAAAKVEGSVMLRQRFGSRSETGMKTTSPHDPPCIQALTFDSPETTRRETCAQDTGVHGNTALRFSATDVMVAREICHHLTQGV